MIDIDTVIACICGDDDEVNGETEHGFTGVMVDLGVESPYVYLC